MAEVHTWFHVASCITNRTILTNRFSLKLIKKKWVSSVPTVTTAYQQTSSQWAGAHGPPAGPLSPEAVTHLCQTSHHCCMDKQFVSPSCFNLLARVVDCPSTLTIQQWGGAILSFWTTLTNLPKQLIYKALALTPDCLMDQDKTVVTIWVWPHRKTGDFRKSKDTLEQEHHVRARYVGPDVATGIWRPQRVVFPARSTSGGHNLEMFFCSPRVQAGLHDPLLPHYFSEHKLLDHKEDQVSVLYILSQKVSLD